MATWMVHFRIADCLLDSIQGISPEHFIVGNIGPDCGTGEKDGSGFDPPASVTHWTPSGRKCEIAYKQFFDAYLKHTNTKEAYSFYLGYYVHLLTDMKWSAQIYMPTHTRYKKEYEENPEFLRIIKVDWYDLDHLYLKQHPDFRAFRMFEQIKQFKNSYLEYYTEQAIETQIHFISDFYNTHCGNPDRTYSYLTRETVDVFVEKTAAEILVHLKKKKLP